jgi:hypothetical protein
MTEKEMAAPTGIGRGPCVSSCDPNTTERDQKWRRILRLLESGKRMTRFDAEKYGDHAFNSTVSYLSARGVRISRMPILIRGRFGNIHCKRYWIEPEDAEQAKALLGSEQ